MPTPGKGRDPLDAQDDDDEDPEEEDDDEEDEEDEEERMVACAAAEASDMTLPVKTEVGHSEAEEEPLTPTADPSSPLAPLQLSATTDSATPATATPPPPRLTGEESPLDFSMKKSDQEEPPALTTSALIKEEPSDDEPEDGPLDLSVPRRRKAGGSAGAPRRHKQTKLEPKPVNHWSYNVPKAPPAATPAKHEPWNGKVKSHHHHHHHHGGQHQDRSKTFAAPAKLSSTSPLAATPVPEGSSSSKCGGGGGGASRQNPWQTQWMSKSGEQAKDVFTCVWCKESFRSLAEMTVHMKQSPRCGMAGMQASSAPPAPAALSPQPNLSTGTSKGTTSPSGASGSRDSSVLVKESMPLPRKLVRGQDVWLGKGAEQTRQILKCMWCGQSFKTLADMTTHMRVTQHYTNIISQEQIISWRTPEDKMAAQSQVNAVLTCKVCDQAFGSLKELSYHMVKNSHYKEHILRSISEGGGRRRQTRERRKKSLPVRKLLELERMEMGKQGGPNPEEGRTGEPADGKITCEECAEKVDAKDFVQHIKSCSAQRNNHQRIKNELCDDSGDEALPAVTSGAAGDGATTTTTTATAPSPSESKPSPVATSGELATTSSATAGTATPTPEEGKGPEKTKGETSVLNAIERLIEKSFEHKGRRGQPSTGILQRLGIDEEVYPPWHPANSPGGKLSSGKGSDRAKSTSPLRFDPGDYSRHDELSRKRLFDAYNHVSASSETSRGSTPISLMNTSSPTRSLTESPHRTHSSMTGSTAGSPPPSPRSPRSPKAPSEFGSVRGEEIDCRGSEAARSPRNGRPDTDGSLCGSPKPTPVPHFDRPSRCSSVSSFDGRRTPLSDADPIRLPSPEPLELKATTTAIAPKRKRPKGRHGGSKNSSKRSAHEDKRSVSVDSVLSSLSSSEGAKASTSDLSADHPLKELQKLLDKTDAHLSRPALPSGPGSILAFSWACNDVTTSDSLMKCAFCETHFISKGAYRHHLSKMHFVKEPMGSPGDSPTWKGSGGDKTKNGTPEGPSSSFSGGPKEAPPPLEESPHSKFLKYTELAKQLSSKYV